MSEVPDTGMGTGSEAGEAGERLADLPLSDDDGRLLQELRRSGPPVVEAREDRPLTAGAVEQDRALPPSGAPAGPGRLDPVFQEPPGSDA
jgi:hypothetical protein